MSEIAISARSLSKMYKLYARPSDRLRELLAFRGDRAHKHYQELWALRDITFDVERGTALGIIGPNGAGKSTLLKTITGNITPTEGELTIKGKVSALLELGIGFHPELTGHQNIYASGTYLGMSKAEIDRKYDEIVSFSELEDFIHQPVKIYSSGMYIRLAFSVATAIEPDVLVIDEVLGVGDAYFAMKCLERMNRICQSGATIVLVSHDLASVLRLCSRTLWIDKGKLVMDGPTLEVSKAYGASVRRQDETRLKARSLRLRRQTVESLAQQEGTNLIFHLVTDGPHPRYPHPICRLAMLSAEQEIAAIAVGDAQDNAPVQGSQVLAYSSTDWGQPRRLDRRYVREYTDVGGSGAHAPFLLLLEQGFSPYLDPMSLVVEYKDTCSERVYVELYDGETYCRVGQLENEADACWKSSRFPIPAAVVCKIMGGQDQSEAEPRQDDSRGRRQPPHLDDFRTENVKRGYIYGTGELTIDSVEFLDGQGEQTHVFTVGDELSVRLRYRALSPVDDPVFVLSVYRLDGVVAMQLVSSLGGLHLDRLEGPGTITLDLGKLVLGRGQYVVTAAAFHNLDPLVGSVEPVAYDLHDRAYEFKVEQPPGINTELGIVVHPVRWHHCTQI